MKKEVLFILFLVFTIFLFNKFYITGFTMLKIDEGIDVSGKFVTIKQISSGSIIVDVSGVSNIVSTTSPKEINGVRITINEIFFVDEKEGRFVKLSLESLYECGDGKCEHDETKESCCKDCGCSLGYICENNKCVLKATSSEHDECQDWEDCEDDNDLTIDRCEGNPKKCVHIEYYQCTTNKDCDDKNDCTKDECRNYECFNSKISGCKMEIEQPTKINQLVDEPKNEKEKGFLSKLFSILFGWLG